MNLSQIINYSIISNLATFRNMGIDINISVLSLLFALIAPLLFPAKLYHNLMKDDKLQTP